MIDVVVASPPGHGWEPLIRMGRLAADWFGGRLIELDSPYHYSRPYLAQQLLPRRRARGVCLVVAPQPVHLNAAVHATVRGMGYESIAGWVVDSFWHDEIPRIARSTSVFDRIYVMDEDDRPAWAAQCRGMVDVLPWGSDTRVYQQVPKDVDVQRVGRQPASWDDDGVNEAEFAHRGLRYAGRPPRSSDDLGSLHAVDRALERAKVMLAFSNLVDGSDYTHSEREYITGRWTDALAAGAVVAGIAPKTSTARSLLWPGACIELPSTDREEGVEYLQWWLATKWSAEVADANRTHARQTLDWRLRFEKIRQDLGVSASGAGVREREAG